MFHFTISNKKLRFCDFADAIYHHLGGNKLFIVIHLITMAKLGYSIYSTTIRVPKLTVSYSSFLAYVRAIWRFQPILHLRYLECTVWRKKSVKGCVTGIYQRNSLIKGWVAYWSWPLSHWMSLSPCGWSGLWNLQMNGATACSGGWWCIFAQKF